MFQNIADQLPSVWAPLAIAAFIAVMVWPSDWLDGKEKQGKQDHDQ